MSSNVMACEKWKSEISMAVLDVGYYINAYNNFEKNQISKDLFDSKADRAIKSLSRIKNRADSESSCGGDVKFEKRRQALRSTLKYAIPVMQVGRSLAPSVREELRRYED